MADSRKEDTQTMLYKFPGSHKIHGALFDYKVVKASEVSDELKSGWSKTTDDALKAASKVELSKVEPESQNRGRVRPRKES